MCEVPAPTFTLQVRKRRSDGLEGVQAHLSMWRLRPRITLHSPGSGSICSHEPFVHANAFAFPQTRAGPGSYVLGVTLRADVINLSGDLNDPGDPRIAGPRAGGAGALFDATDPSVLFHRYRPTARPENELTPHETRLLKLLVQGHNYKTAAAELDVSVNTISFHIRHIYEKLRGHSKSEAVAKALRSGLIA